MVIGRLSAVVRVRLQIVIVSGRFDFLDHGVEPVLAVGRVLDQSGGTVGFHQTVRSFDVAVAVALLPLALDVLRVQILHAVLEMVRGGGRRRVLRVVVIAAMLQIALAVVVITLVLLRWGVSKGQVVGEQSYDGHRERYDRLDKKKKYNARVNIIIYYAYLCSWSDY